MAYPPEPSRNRRRLPLLPPGLFRRLVALALVLALLPTGLLAQQLDPSINTQQAAALGAIADMVTLSSDRVGQMLKDYGYQPANEAAWQRLPAIRQLEAAYLAFEVASPRTGGGQFLAMLSSDLARRYQAVRYETALEPYLANARPSPLTPTGPAQLPPLAERPPPQVAAAIEKIAQYCEGNAFGGTHGVLTSHFGLRPSEAYEILRSAESNAEALTRGLSRVAPEARHQAMASVVSDIDFAYGPAAKAETSFDPFRPPGRRQVAMLPPIFSDGRGGPPTPPTTPPPGPSGSPGPGPRRVSPHGPGGAGGGGGPTIQLPDLPRAQRPAVQELNRQYGDFLRRNHGTKPRRTFSRMTRTSRGFGGVVFGSQVEAAAGLPNPKWVDWVPPNAGEDGKRPAAGGRLVFHFERNNGGARESFTHTFGPVLQEDVYVAERMVYGTFEGVPRWESGEGVGLVGIDDPVPYFDAGEEELVNEGRRWRVLLHPALVDSRLGWAALMVDVLPISQEQFAEMVMKNAEANDRLKFRRWLSAAPSGWKFTDVPVRVSAKNARLVVERRPDGADTYSQELRGSAFLNVLDGDGRSETSFSKEFYPLIPVLTQSSQAHDRLNRFAAVLALLRWARDAGATVRTKAERPPEDPTPVSVIITEDGLITAPGYARETAGGELRDKLDRRLAQLSHQFPAGVRPALEQLRQSWRAVAEQLETASLRERLADEKYTDLMDEIEDAVASSTPGVREQFEKLRSQRSEAYRQWLLASDDGAAAQARNRLDEAEARMGEFMATSFAQLAEKESALKREEEAASRQAESSLRDMKARLEALTQQERQVEATLISGTPEAVRTDYERISADLASARLRKAQAQESLKQLEAQEDDLQERFNSRLAAAPAETRQRYAALLAEATQLLDAPAGSEEEEARVRRRLVEIEGQTRSLMNTIFPEYVHEEQSLDERLTSVEESYLEASRRTIQLEAEKRRLLERVNPELSRWHMFATRYLRTIVR